MTNNDIDFAGWFEFLHMHLSERGICFDNADSVIDDYEAGKNLFDVAEEIADEFL